VVQPSYLCNALSVFDDFNLFELRKVQGERLQWWKS